MNIPRLNVIELLKKYGIRPTKGLGQNFLVSEGALEKVARSAEIQPEDTVLEIGPGVGSLTRYLAAAARRVVAVELDAALLPALEEVVEPYQNVEIVHGDILKVNLAESIPEPGYIVVANVPYYITSALLRHLLEADILPARLTLTLQREVAERICSKAGSMSLLALSVQVYGKPKIMAHIPPGAFYPRPKVESSVVRVDLYPESRIPAGDIDIFFLLIKAGFSQKRKTLRNTLSAGMRWTKEQSVEMLQKAEIDPQRRAQTLSIDEWAKLVDVVVGIN